MSAWADRAPAAVFTAVGSGMRDAVDDLFLLPMVQRAVTPRAAALLLVAGAIRPGDEAALRRLHDQLPHPRATLWWDARPLDDAGPQPRTIAGAADAQAVAQALREAQLSLLRDPAASESDWQADAPPAPWQGLGDHGQGGKGMMGGQPYGRAMAMTAGDLRDGLQLDAFTLRLGPFAPMLPAGLALELTLQGDVVQHAAVLAAPLPPAAVQGPGTPLRDAALLLDLLELPALAERCRRLARDAAAPARAALLRTLRRCGVFAAIPPGLGRLATGGPDVRARLQGLLAGDPPAPAGPPAEIGALLRGLEWQEMLLVLASLQRPCFAAPEPAA